jgi:hypothetical protein
MLRVIIREMMKTARISKKIFVFKALPQNLPKHFLHMPVMRTFPVNLPTVAALPESFMFAVYVIRNSIPHVFSLVHTFKFGVAARAA